MQFIKFDSGLLTNSTVKTLMVLLSMNDLVYTIVIWQNIIKKQI